MLPSIEQRLSLELAAKPVQVAAAITLLDEGATVPFIARYRKEATGGLDDIQLRLLEERLRYLRELEDRRAAIIASIEEQGKMTPALLASLANAEDKMRLEDLYLPFKKKRRTKAQIAMEAGLQPLADSLLANPMLHPEEEAGKYLKPAFTTEQGDNPGVEDTKAALDGARQILMERFAEDATLLQWLREYLLAHGVVESKSRCNGQRRGRRKVCRLFRLFRNDQHYPFASRPGDVPWPPRRNPECWLAPGFRSGKAEMGCAAQPLRRRISPRTSVSGIRTVQLTHG